MKAIKVSAAGHAEVVEVTGLKDMQAAVGGYIEYVGLGDQANLICNEDGKMLGLNINPIAAVLTKKYQALRPRDFIVGDILVVGPVDEDGNDTDVPQELVDHILTLIH